VILYEMLAGEVPFSGRTPTEIMLKSSAEPPAPLAAFRQDLPAEIEPVVLQAMAKNPEMRFHTVDEFAAALARVSRNYGEQETVVIPHTPVEEPANNNIWKTAFVVLAGISLLAIGLIYATSVKQTDPATQMQTDANGQPVQPINPATGTDEQALSNLAAGVPEIVANSNMMAIPPGAVVPGGDGYNPWGGSGPPAGAPPQTFPQGGQVITIDPNTGSPFTQDGNIILIPVPANTAAVNANVKPSPTPRGNAANANAAAPPASNTAPNPTPNSTPAAKPTPQPTKPAEQPKASPPAATEKRAQSGKEQDS
jgi:serine/threonine-protein kinase